MSNFRRRRRPHFKDPDSWRGDAARRRDVRHDPLGSKRRPWRYLKAILRQAAGR
jgi:hypothetical protein